MADFEGLKFTNNGLNIEYKAQAGKEFKFTKFIIGDGNYTGSIRSLESLVHPIMTAEIKRMNLNTNSENKKITIGFNLNTTEIEIGFYLREIGLYARDPDTGEEKLAFYTNAGDSADYISPRGTTIEELLMDFDIYISDVENITAIIDSSLVYATQKEFDEFKTEIEDKIHDTIVVSKTEPEQDCIWYKIINTREKTDDDTVMIETTDYTENTIHSLEIDNVLEEIENAIESEDEDGNAVILIE